MRVADRPQYLLRRAALHQKDICTSRKRLRTIARVHRQDNYAYLWPPLLDSTRCLQPVHARHVNVQENDIWVVPLRLLQGRLAVRSIPHYLDIRELAQQGLQALTGRPLIIRYQYAHWAPHTVVPFTCRR